MRDVPSLKQKLSLLPGPILVLGAGGFVGSNLWEALRAERDDVWGTLSPRGSWRLSSHPRLQVSSLEQPGAVEALVETIRPNTIFNCLCYGGYPHQKDTVRLFAVNAEIPARILETLQKNKLEATLIQAGSASEYGDVARGPTEEQSPEPHSLYGVSKHAGSEALHYFGRRGVRCANLRFYSVYGPKEEPSRLIPQLLLRGRNGNFPPLAQSNISHDFVYVEDACEAMVDCALNLDKEDWGKSFNIASGKSTTLETLAAWSKERFCLKQSPHFQTYPPRPWDTPHWVGNPKQSLEKLGWNPRHDLVTGLEKTLAALDHPPESRPKTVSIVVACYGDGEAIPPLYDRLNRVLHDLNVVAQLIFVDDGSTDDTAEQIRQLSVADGRVLGVRHSRNFGSQQAFRSGMEVATGEGCILLDGDLQDPPELIGDFVREWGKGWDVVYGVRDKRDEFLFLRLGRAMFYRLLKFGSDIEIPSNAGDFCLMDQQVVREILRHTESQTLLRGLRSRVGFRQTGVSYHRPKRPFGRSNYSLGRYLEYAKTALFAFGGRLARHYLHFALLAGVGFFVFGCLSPTTFQSGLLMGIGFLVASSGLLMEQLQKIANELRRRPPFIRSEEIRHGEILPWKTPNCS